MAVKIGKSEIASSRNGLVVERKAVEEAVQVKEVVKEAEKPVESVDVAESDVVVDDVQKKVARTSRKKTKKTKVD